MKFIGRLSLLAAALSCLALPVQAKDWHGDSDRYHGHDSHYRGGHYGSGPRVGIGIGIVPQPYYYRSPSTVIVEREGRGYADSRDDLGASVQRALARRGYYRGPIDGDIGPGSRAAIRDYQADRGLPISGRIDRRLIDSLL
jgi:hypothetical protein